MPRVQVPKEYQSITLAGGEPYEVKGGAVEVREEDLDRFLQVDERFKPEGSSQGGIPAKGKE